MALAENALIDFSYIQSMIGIDSSEQDYYETLINAASRYADFKAGYMLISKDYTSYLESYKGSTKIVLPVSPVNQVTLLKVDGSRVFGADSEITDYDLDEGSGVIHLLNRELPGGRKTIYIEYNAGYNPIPEDLRYATYEVVQWMRDRGVESIGRKTFVGADGVDIGFEMTPPVSAQRVFENYWRPF